MANALKAFFSDADREAIHAATAKAERETSGELVVYVVERCDPHPEIAWKGALVGGAIGAACAALAIWQFGGWGAPDSWWMLVGLQLGLLAGWLLSRFPAVGRRLIDAEALLSRVEGRAAEAFVEESVFATKERTGVLIFVALFEHRVVVLADEGIEARVGPNAWNRVTQSVTGGIREGRPARALIHAIEQCAALLGEHGVTSADASNEISNEPRFRGA